MALLQRVLSKSKALEFTRVAFKNFSNESSIKKSVFISQSKDVYTNLALQDWIYKNLDLSNHHILMLWQNDPCITIGKNDNPWLEANIGNLPNITETGVKLARQKTDGPSMYHDGGNLNMTFFTPNDHFNEKYNMEVVARALFRDYSLKLDAQAEIFMRGYKMSRSTHKIGDTNAYHHCNLLVNINKIDCFQSLMKEELGIQQRQSTKAEGTKLINLCEENSSVTVQKLLKTIGWEFMRTPAFTIGDGGKELIRQQKGFQMINPTENWFPGIDEIRNGLNGWNWLYGNTPKFEILRSFHIPENLRNHMEDLCDNLKIKITVSGGIIKDVSLSIPLSMYKSCLVGEVNIITTSLIGRAFSGEILNYLQNSIQNIMDDKEKILSDGLRQVMFSF